MTATPPQFSVNEYELVRVKKLNSLYQQVQTVSKRISVGTVAPSSPSVNDLWVDTN